ncbi:FG-GAP-like repeat-containing protein [Chitinophaga sp.]|uniref:FG-GAP-like repeat-containing protein n=1 Tax=Chitinophaga sp. TaxID=1869181 RepID=UPI0031D57D9C
MKQFYLLFTFLVFSINTMNANTKPNVENDQLSKLQKHVERIQYAVKKQTDHYQSPNHKNGVTASYKGDEMTITPQDLQEQWSFSLTVKGIIADGRSLYKPTGNSLITTNENDIQFNHNNQFTVEYVNDADGIRQNFIIQNPRIKTRCLQVQLRAEKGWEVSKESATSLLFKQRQQLLTYKDLKVWDANGKILPAHFSVQHEQIQIAVDVKNAVYPITVDPLTANGNPTNADAIMKVNMANAQLGTAAANAGDINGDGYDDVIIGAPYYSNGESDEGAVFVYYGSSNGISPNNPTILEKNIADGHFGIYLAGGGDVNGDGYDDIVVGCPYVSGTFGYDVGSIYVYYGSSSGVNSTPDILQSTRSGDYFGIAVAIVKNYNGDKYADIVVGADKGDGYISVIYGNRWGVLNSVISEATHPYYTNFGVRVADAGDVNGDGLGDFMVAAIDTVYIFHGNTDGEIYDPVTILTEPVKMYYDWSIAGAGDINGDGFDDVMVGDKYLFDYDNNINYAGRVYIYYGKTDGSGINTTAGTVLTGTQANGYFGYRTATAGDLNGDGYSDIMISAPEAESNSSTQASEGYVYVYLGQSGGLNTTPYSLIQSNKAGAKLGMSLAGGMVEDASGKGSILVGAPFYTQSYTSQGIALYYLGDAAIGTRKSETIVTEENAVEKNSSATIKAFPNPAVNNLSIQYEGLNAAINTYIQVIDVKGNLIKTVELGGVEKGNQMIDVTGLTPGMYIVTVKNGEKIFKEKIIKQ